MRARVRTVIVFIALAVGACATVAPDQFRNDMLAAGAALTKVSAAAEALAHSGAPPGDLSDQNFLEESVAHDPALLAPLSKYLVKARRSGKHAALLVCTRDGNRALLEDAGCTAALDLHRWRDKPATACDFALDLVVVCATPAPM